MHHPIETNLIRKELEMRRGMMDRWALKLKTIV